MTQFSLAEAFVSINGEGTRAGELAVFLRFCGCNLACSFCDTTWANQPDVPSKQVTAEELVAYVQKTGVRNVTLTGGEPLLQPGIEILITELCALGYQVEIETNGSVSCTLCFSAIPPFFHNGLQAPRQPYGELHADGKLCAAASLRYGKICSWQSGRSGTGGGGHSGIFSGLPLSCLPESGIRRH